MGNFYYPKEGDLVRLTRGGTPALVIDANKSQATILYSQSGHRRTDPVTHLHRWEDSVDMEQIDGFIDQLERLNLPVAKRRYLMNAVRRYKLMLEAGRMSYHDMTLSEIPSQGNEMKPQAKAMAKKAKKEEEMKTLYSWVENEVTMYGHKLATNSAGEWVMERKGGGVVSVAKELVSEVMPYTVDVEYGGGCPHNTYSFFAKEGEFKVGDVVAHPLYKDLVHVRKLDTKSKKATTWLYGMKLAGTVVENGE